MPSLLDGVQLHRVDSMAELSACWSWLAQRRDGPLFFDTESEGLDPTRDKCRLIQLGDKQAGWAFPQPWFGAATEMLDRYEGELGAHNSPYDWRVLNYNSGLKLPWHKIHDTLLAGHLTDSMRLAGLKPRATLEVDGRAAVAAQRLDDAMAKQHWTWKTVPDDLPEYWQYGALDCPLAAHLWDKFGPQVTGQFREAYDLERATARICAGMMMAGMKVDVPYIRAKITELEEWAAQARPWLASQLGITSVNSNAQFGAALERMGVPVRLWTDGGQPAADKEAMAFYAAEYPRYAQAIGAIARMRKVESIIGRYLEKFLRLRDGDDIMHYTINSCRARTSRQSVTDPPMQTFDRDEPAIRGSFVPREGHVLISIDADQIEARMGAHFSADPQMIADFHEADRTGQSFFVIMASKIFGELVSKKDPRYTRTKNATYGQIYGAGLEKAAVTAGVPVAQMRPVYEGTQRLYPGIPRLMNQLIREGKSGGRPQVRTLTGRRLYAQRGHEYALLNYKIQGSAAEIMKRGICDLDAAGYGPYLRLPVHDEILMEVPAEHASEALRGATDILTDRENFSIPITWAGSILPERWCKV
jgi:DNA polymerase I